MRFDTVQDLYEAILNQERSFNETDEEVQAQLGNPGGERSSQSSYSGMGSGNSPTILMSSQSNPLFHVGSPKSFREPTGHYRESPLNPRGSQHTVSGPRCRFYNLCHRCGLAEHYARDCRTAILTCFNCGGTGHKTNNCPEKRTTIPTRSKDTTSETRTGPSSKQSAGLTKRSGGRVFSMDPLATQKSRAAVTGLPAAVLCRASPTAGGCWVGVAGWGRLPGRSSGAVGGRTKYTKAVIDGKVVAVASVSPRLDRAYSLLGSAARAENDGGTITVARGGKQTALNAAEMAAHACMGKRKDRVEAVCG
ncbi:hypothetical protein Droror1_Dr00017666 [Drosera rotundifolia]